MTRPATIERKARPIIAAKPHGRISVRCKAACSANGIAAGCRLFNSTAALAPACWTIGTELAARTHTSRSRGSGISAETFSAIVNAFAETFVAARSLFQRLTSGHTAQLQRHNDSRLDWKYDRLV